MGKYPTVDPDSIDAAGLLKMIDYTLLRPEEPLDAYARFIATARDWGFGSVFVPPYYAPLAAGMLSATDVKIGVPVSFPFGYAAPEIKAAEALAALEEGALEVDVVMNISAARSGEWESVDEDLSTVVAAVREWEKLTHRGAVVAKLILETAYLDDDQKREACRRAAAAGMDYVKTSTGLGPGGATAGDVRLMREVVGDEVGVKAAGGIRTWEDAKAMIAAGADRIGTSAGPELVEDFKRVAG
jgi:deoxyribose-phosphate aldolase